MKSLFVALKLRKKWLYLSAVLQKHRTIFWDAQRSINSDLNKFNQTVEKKKSSQMKAILKGIIWWIFSPFRRSPQNVLEKPPRTGRAAAGIAQVQYEALNFWMSRPARAQSIAQEEASLQWKQWGQKHGTVLTQTATSDCTVKAQHNFY